MKSARHILVIGGAGYVGSVLVGHLLQNGYRVRVLDALLYGNEEVLASHGTNSAFSFVAGDFRDAERLEAALNGVTDVVMLAALVGDPLCRKYPDLARAINEVGTAELIQRLKGRDLNRLVFMSTCSNYGLRESDEPADESCVMNPRSLYAETKVAIERLLLEQVDALDFGVTVLRGATAYGLSPRMRFDLTVNEFTREMAAGNDLLVYDADTWRPYCHVDDMALAINAVLEANPARVDGQVFNLGREGENFTKRMLIERLMSLIPQASVRYQDGEMDPRNYRVSFSRICALLHKDLTWGVYRYLPQLVTSIKEGRFDDYGERLDFYRNQSLNGHFLT